MTLETTRADPSAAPRVGPPPDGRRVRPTPYSLAIGAVLGVFLCVALVNARTYPVDAGYDALHHREYVHILLHEQRLPGAADGGTFNKPPLFYGLAAATEWVATKAGLGFPAAAVQYVNVLLVLGAALLVLALARLLWPSRPALHVAALGFFAFVPIVLKTAAMYYPGTLALFFAAAAMFLAARLLSGDRFRPGTAVALAAVLMLGLLTFTSSLAVFAGVGLALVLALLVAAPAARRGALVALLGVVTLTAVMATTWFVRQPDASPQALIARGAPVYRISVHRGPDFFLGTGLPAVLTEPQRVAYRDQMLPIAYSELWGDDLSVWAWGDWLGEERSQQGQRALQNWIGILPTLLALAGWLAVVALVARRPLRSRPELLPVALVPAFGLAALAYYGFAIPTPDGDTVKGFYVLPTAPAWAVAFGLTVDAVARGRRARAALVAALVALALVNVRFLVFGRPLDPFL